MATGDMGTRRIVGVIALAGLWGCSMTHGVRGVAVQRADCSGGAAAPIAGAEVRVECPGAAPWTARTDAKGKFYIELEDGLPNTCMVRVTKEGYGEIRRKLGDICVRAVQMSQECDAASLYAELAAAAAPPPADPGPTAALAPRETP